MKRSPLKRGTKPLKRTPLANGESQMARSRLKPISESRQRVNAERKTLMVERFGNPDTWACQLRPIIGTPCFGEVHGHEVLSRSRAGRTDTNLLDMDGILLACDFHNGWVEDHPIEAHGLGLAKHSWE